VGNKDRNYCGYLIKARNQNGVVAVGQGGLTPDKAHYEAKIGRLHRIHRGIYALVPRSLLSRDGLYMAAVLACGPGAALSHRSAAALHGLRQEGTTKVEVLVPHASSRRHRGIRVRRSRVLTAADVTKVKGIPVTTIVRTLLDLADVLSRRPLERAFDQAEILEGLDLNAINDQLDRNPTRPATKRTKALLEEHYIGSTPTASELEDAFVVLSRTVGLPKPEVNGWIVLNDGEPPIKGDFVWRAQRIVIETDGRRTHGTRQAFESDRRRDQRLMAAGWRVIRTTWRQVMRKPEELEFLLRQLVGQGSPAAGAAPAPRPRRTPRGAGSTSSARRRPRA
jgi:very-short-patch-repair endonuclease